MKTEQRSFQIRAAQGEEFVLAGRALSYMEVSSNELASGLRERLMPGCFRDALASPDLDCKALFNHDASQILGRTKNGTLMLSDRADGLYMRVQLDKNNSKHRDVYASVNRGDLDEMSFAFTSDDEDYEDGEYNGARCKIRNIRKAQLFDVSVVTSPFYGKGATAVSARATGAPALAGAEFDKYARAKAEQFRHEMCMAADKFIFKNKRTGQPTKIEDPEGRFEPVFEESPEAFDARMRVRARAIREIVRTDLAELADIERQEAEREKEERRKREFNARVNHIQRGGGGIC